MMMDELLGTDSNPPLLFSPLPRTTSNSYFSDDVMSYFPKDASASTFSLEDTIEFTSAQVPSASFEDFSAPEDLTPSTSCDPPASINVHDAFKKEESLTPALPDDEDDISCVTSDSLQDPNWEIALEQLITEFDGQVPIDEKLKSELVEASVKEFNRRAKQLKLEPQTIHYLKLHRKRVKNRLAAIRSRSRRDIQVSDLQGQVDKLTGENRMQKHQIAELQKRLALMEQAAKMRGFPY